MEPYVVRQVFDADGNTQEEFGPGRPLRVLSPAAASALTEMMERVVTNGTGRRATVPGVRVAGKTGTAQGADGVPDLWFVGFAPVEAPTMALAILIEDGGASGDDATGGSIAAPIAARLFEEWLTP